MVRAIRIRNLPEPVLNYLWLYEYRDKNSESYVCLHTELDKFGYEFVEEQDVAVGDYNDLRGYMDCLIRRMY